MLSKLFLFAISAVSVTVSCATLKPVGAIDLPGEAGKRFDYLTVDTDHNYLLSAHLGAGLLYVIDLKSQKLLNAIPGVPGVEGVEYVPGMSKAYTSNWGDHTIGVVDLKTMSVVKRIPAENKPDGSVYAPDFGKVYVSDERAKALIVIDVHSDQVVKTLRFSSETGMPQYDPVTKKVLLNLQDENILAEIDPATDSVSATHPVEKCKGNHGMILDSSKRRGFLACEGSNSLAVVNLETHHTIATIPLPVGVDVVKYDSGLGRIYAACSSGFISVIRAGEGDQYRKLQDFPVEKKVHSLGVDPATHRVYAPEQEEKGKPASRMVIYEAI